MIGIVLVTQGALGEALRETMEHVVGPQEQLRTLGIGASDNLVVRQRELDACIAAVDTGDGVMLVTDMFGSTPSNLAVAMAKPGRIEVLGGANLPMLVKLAQLRAHHSLSECTTMAQAAAHKYINCASHLPAQCLEGARRCAEEVAREGAARTLTLPTELAGRGVTVVHPLPSVDEGPTLRKAV